MVVMINAKTLRLSVKSLREFAKKRLADAELIALDARDECPLDIVRHMCSPDKLGIQLLFIPEEFGGFGLGQIHEIAFNLRADDHGFAGEMVRGIIAHF